MQALAVKEIHHQEHASFVVDVAVKDARNAGMVHPVRNHPLGHEPLAGDGIGRQRGVKHLDGDASAASVRRGVHGGRSADAEQRVEPVPSAKNDLIRWLFDPEAGADLGPPMASSRERARCPDVAFHLATASRATSVAAPGRA